MKVENTIVAKLNVTLDDPEIAAHFPQKPILAAYKQIALLESLFKEKLVGVRDMKFKSQIVPPCEVIIEIEGNKFEIKVADKIKTSGKLILK